MEKRPWTGCHRLRRGRFVLAAAFTLCGQAQTPGSAPSPPSAEDLQASPPAAPVADTAPAIPADASETGTISLAAWIDALAQAESGNRERIVHRDRDGQLYYGCLQFQEHTFRVYVRKFHLLPKASRAEVRSRIFDCAFQKQLAMRMLRDDPRNWRHWKGTVEKRVGRPPSELSLETSKAGD